MKPEEFNKEAIREFLEKNQDHPNKAITLHELHRMDPMPKIIHYSGSESDKDRIEIMKQNINNTKALISAINRALEFNDR